MGATSPGRLMVAGPAGNPELSPNGTGNSEHMLR